jgi:hypothetical protein
LFFVTLPYLTLPFLNLPYLTLRVLTFPFLTILYFTFLFCSLPGASPLHDIVMAAMVDSGCNVDDTLRTRHDRVAFQQCPPSSSLRSRSGGGGGGVRALYAASASQSASAGMDYEFGAGDGDGDGDEDDSTIARAALREFYDDGVNGDGDGDSDEHGSAPMHDDDRALSLTEYTALIEDMDREVGSRTFFG